MAQLQIATGSTLAEKTLMSEVFTKQVALQNPLEQQGMIGPGKGFIVQLLNSQLDKGGDSITYHRKNKLTGPGHDEGDPKEGFEQAVAFHDDAVTVSSKEFTVRVSLVMDDQRTLLDMVDESMDSLRDQVAEWKSWVVLTYLSGKVGTNVQILTTGFTSWAGNTLTDVDSNHLMYGGNATQKSDVDSADTFVLSDLVRFTNKARTLTYKIPTIKIKGRNLNVVLVHPDVWRDLKTATSGQTLYDIDKAMLSGGQDPMANGLVTAASAIINGCIIIVCEQCAIYTDYGAGSVRASRVLFLGPQAAVWAMGRKAQKVEWVFEKKTFEYNSEVGICARTIGGCKAVIYNSERSAMLAMDVATLAA